MKVLLVAVVVLGVLLGPGAWASRRRRGKVERDRMWLARVVAVVASVLWLVALVAIVKAVW